MKIEINIESQLEEIWKKIGFTDDEIDAEYSSISEKVQDLFISILTNLTKISENLERKVEDLESDLYQYSKLIGIKSDSIKINTNQSLKIRYEQASKQLFELKNAFSTRSKNYDSIFELLTNLFTILEIPPKERGVFREKGNDITIKKIDEAGNLLFELKEAVDIRQKKMQILISELNDIHNKLHLDPVDFPEKLGNQTFSKHEKELSYLKDIYQNYIIEKKNTLKKIHQIEEFFSINSPDFVIESEKEEKMMFFDETELDNLLNYLKELQKEKVKKLPEFIERDKQKIIDLYQELHIDIPTIHQFPALYYKCSKNNSWTSPSSASCITDRNNIFINGQNDVLNQLDKEIERLSLFKEETTQIRKFLLQRDRILKISKRKSKKLLSFNQIVADERMITVDLPIINIQLEPLLEEFERKNETPFIWDGKNVLEEIRGENSNFKEKTGMVHNRYVSTIYKSKK